METVADCLEATLVCYSPLKFLTDHIFMGILNNRCMTLKPNR